MVIEQPALPLDQIICGDNCDVMRKLPSEAIDLVVTSPPYDNLRTYSGLNWNFELLAVELYRVIKEGGVVVWVVADATKDGNETGTSFRQALHFQEIGFNLADTMIYHKTDMAFNRYGHRKYPGAFEFMFILSKGMVGTFNLIKDRKNVRAGEVMTGNSVRQVTGESTKNVFSLGNEVAEVGSRTNVWGYGTGWMKSSGDKSAFDHPAIFPEALARDHIFSWSNEGDVVLDPFSGSGTTAKMAKYSGRRFIGIEVNPEYVEISKKRLAQELLF